MIHISFIGFISQYYDAVFGEILLARDLDFPYRFPRDSKISVKVVRIRHLEDA